MFDIHRVRFRQAMGSYKYDKTSKKKGISKSSSTKKTKSGDYQKGRELPVQPKAELKCLDTGVSQAFANIAAPPTFVCLNPVTVGAEIYQRTGRKTYNKSLHLKGMVYPANGTPSGEPAFLRLVLLYDSQANAANPAIATVFKDTNAVAATNVFSELNLDNRERFKVLREWKWYMGRTTNVTNLGQAQLEDGSQCLIIDEFVKLKRIETIFNATNGGTIADIQSGSLLLVPMCDSVSTSAAWVCTLSARLRYYD